MMKRLNRKKYFLSILILLAAAFVSHRVLTSTDYYASLSLTGVLINKLIIWLVIYLLMTPLLIARMRDAGMRGAYVIVFWLSYFANVEMVLLAEQFVDLDILVEKVLMWFSFLVGIGALVLLLYLLIKPPMHGTATE